MAISPTTGLRAFMDASNAGPGAQARANTMIKDNFGGLKQLADQYVHHSDPYGRNKQQVYTALGLKMPKPAKSQGLRHFEGGGSFDDDYKRGYLDIPDEPVAVAPQIVIPDQLTRAIPSEGDGSNPIITDIPEGTRRPAVFDNQREHVLDSETVPAEPRGLSDKGVDIPQDWQTGEASNYDREVPLGRPAYEDAPHTYSGDQGAPSPKSDYSESYKLADPSGARRGDEVPASNVYSLPQVSVGDEMRNLLPNLPDMSQTDEYGQPFQQPAMSAERAEGAVSFPQYHPSAQTDEFGQPFQQPAMSAERAEGAAYPQGQSAPQMETPADYQWTPPDPYRGMQVQQVDTSTADPTDTVQQNRTSAAPQTPDDLSSTVPITGKDATVADQAPQGGEPTSQTPATPTKEPVAAQGSTGSKGSKGLPQQGGDWQQFLPQSTRDGYLPGVKAIMQSGKFSPEVNALDPEIIAAAQKYQIDPNAVKAVIQRESGGRSRPGAAGEAGIGQITQGTAKTYGLDHGRLATDNAYAVDSVAKILADNTNKLGDLDKGIAAYNAGQGGVRKAVRQSGQEGAVSGSSSVRQLGSGASDQGSSGVQPETAMVKAPAYTPGVPTGGQMTVPVNAQDMANRGPPNLTSSKLELSNVGAPGANGAPGQAAPGQQAPQEPGFYKRMETGMNSSNPLVALGSTLFNMSPFGFVGQAMTHAGGNYETNQALKQSQIQEHLANAESKRQGNQLNAMVMNTVAGKYLPGSGGAGGGVGQPVQGSPQQVGGALRQNGSATLGPVGDVGGDPRAPVPGRMDAQGNVSVLGPQGPHNIGNLNDMFADARVMQMAPAFKDFGNHLQQQALAYFNKGQMLSSDGRVVSVPGADLQAAKKVMIDKGYVPNESGTGFSDQLGPMEAARKDYEERLTGIRQNRDAETANRQGAVKEVYVDGVKTLVPEAQAANAVTGKYVPGQPNPGQPSMGQSAPAGVPQAGRGATNAPLSALGMPVPLGGDKVVAIPDNHPLPGQAPPDQNSFQGRQLKRDNEYIDALQETGAKAPELQNRVDIVKDALINQQTATGKFADTKADLAKVARALPGAIRPTDQWIEQNLTNAASYEVAAKNLLMGAVIGDKAVEGSSAPRAAFYNKFLAEKGNPQPGMEHEAIFEMLGNMTSMVDYASTGYKAAQKYNKIAGSPEGFQTWHQETYDVTPYTQKGLELGKQWDQQYTANRTQTGSQGEGQGEAAKGSQAAPFVPKTQNDYNSIPKGSYFQKPDGSVWKKG